MIASLSLARHPRPPRAHARTLLVASLALAPLTQCRPPDRSGAFGELAAKDVTGCCTNFRVGYDMLVTDFGVDPLIRPAFVAFAQEVGDYVVLSTRMIDEVTGACRDLALDFGGSQDDLSLKGRSGSESTYAWCNLAARRLQDAFSDALQPAGRFTTHFAPSDCWVDEPIVARCEAGCSTDTSCQEKPASQRCDGAELGGMCPGNCTGACEGSAAVPASCDGTCDAQCQGGCLGGCWGSCEGVVLTGDRCRGTCIGTCQGICKGSCTGACHYRKGGAAKCDGPCKGGCEAQVTAPKCAADLGAPRCPVDGPCEASCRALGQAHASCTPPSVTITLGEDVSRQTAADLGLQTRLRDLATHLPRLMNAAVGRGPQLESEARGAFDAGGAIVADRNKGAEGRLGLTGSACARVMLAAGEQSLQDFHIANDAARIVLRTLPVPK